MGSTKVNSLLLFRITTIAFELKMSTAEDQMKLLALGLLNILYLRYHKEKKVNHKYVLLND